ncbi:hypothetical protein EYF80_005901 [Liparis tanakae]|uniref:Uncharacterized protein n=1 Tax=Liparis tanakae TaxID=230148 RepID=A0A4Z2J068_9TELE|nr:hypothetical protein EYF80_005901 [Liparis tanakae]
MAGGYEHTGSDSLALHLVKLQDDNTISACVCTSLGMDYPLGRNGRAARTPRGVLAQRVTARQRSIFQNGSPLSGAAVNTCPHKLADKKKQQPRGRAKIILHTGPSPHKELAVSACNRYWEQRGGIDFLAALWAQSGAVVRAP